MYLDLLFSVISLGFLTSAFQPTDLTLACLRTPLQARDSLICKAPSSSERGQHRRSISSSLEWDGPHHCVDDCCIFSDPIFGGGISIVSTIENAKIAASFPVVDQQRHIAPRYYEAPVPGKGLGLVANSTIRKGETILVRTPTLMTQRLAHTNLDRDDRALLYEEAVRRLPPTARTAFMNQYGTDIVNKVNLNCFMLPLTTDQPGEHLGCFPEESRFNHDCRPSIYYRIKNITHTAVAVRDIHPGEELTVSYIDTMAPRAERQKKLRQWGFNCSCSQCSLSEEGVAASDERLRKIAEVEADLNDFTSPTVTAETGTRLVELYEAERLDIYLARAYTMAALNYALFGEVEKARIYAAKAAEASEREWGPASTDMKAMRLLAEDPEKHWTWGRTRNRSGDS